jgi:hypothetical protein
MELILNRRRPENVQWELKNNSSHLHDVATRSGSCIKLWSSGLTPCSLVAGTDVSKEHATYVLKTINWTVEAPNRMD